jgi:hypothetical protein
MSRYLLGAFLCFATSAFGTDTYITMGSPTYLTESISASLTGTAGNALTNVNSLGVMLFSPSTGWELSGTITTNLPATPDGSTFSNPLDLDFVGSLTCLSSLGCGGVTASFTFNAGLSSFNSTLPYSVAIMGSSSITNGSSDVFYNGDFAYTTPTVGAVGNYNFTNSGTALFTNAGISETWGITVAGKSVASGGVITFSDPGLMFGSNSLPEPATFGLLGAGLGGLILAYRRRRS